MSTRRIFQGAVCDIEELTCPKEILDDVKSKVHLLEKVAAERGGKYGLPVLQVERLTKYLCNVTSVSFEHNTMLDGTCLFGHRCVSHGGEKYVEQHSEVADDEEKPGCASLLARMRQSSFASRTS